MTSPELIRYSERPELWAETAGVTEEVWPEYNSHGAVLNEYWGRLFDDFPGNQFVLYDGDILSEGHTAPCCWDGTLDGLGDGIDEMIVAAFEAHDAGRRPNTLCALAAEIRPRFQGRGLASRILDAMALLDELLRNLHPNSAALATIIRWPSNPAGARAAPDSGPARVPPSRPGRSRPRLTAAVAGRPSLPRGQTPAGWRSR